MLFSDIEGSTEMLGKLGPSYGSALAEHRTLLRNAWTKWGGLELSTEGDSFFVTFESALMALTAAIEAQRGMQARQWPDGSELRVRIGIHTGEPVEQPEGLVGMDVHRAARIAATGHGGQIVISDATRALVLGALPRGVRVVDLGHHRLKDLPEPERLYHVVIDGLIEKFPPLRALGTATSLPRPWAPLVDRRRELGTLRRLLTKKTTRLVTLVGPAGCGKSRLAIELASRVADNYPDGVHFVSLAVAIDEATMWSSIAEALGISDQRDRRSSTLEYTARSRALLVLDNLEQIVGAEDVVHEILKSSPWIAVLATSRSPLHLRAEHEFHLLGLAVPTSADPEDIVRSDAVQLFRQRARANRSTFELDANSAPHVSRICQRVDGLPLAIELVAARVALLSPSALVSRLDEVTRSDAHLAGRPGRHQSLHGAIAWSYDLLDAEDRHALQCISVFSGGADLRAVEAVLADGRDALTTVSMLVDASLAWITNATDGEPRVHLLQTIGDFARDRLVEAGKLADAKDRHAGYYLGIAGEYAPQLFSGAQLRARDRLESEVSNFRVALDWSLGPQADPANHDRIRVGARLASRLWWFWAHTGSTVEGRNWLERAAKLLPVEDTADVAEALFARGALLAGGTSAERTRSRRLMSRSLEICRHSGDERGIARALMGLSWPYGSPYSFEILREMLEESIEISTRIGDSTDPTLARATYRLGEVEACLGRHDEAIALFTTARSLASERGDEFLTAAMQDVLIGAMIRADKLEPARASLVALGREALRLRGSALRTQVLETFQLYFVHTGDAKAAARLLGAHQTSMREAGRTAEDGSDEYLTRLAQVRATVTPDDWEAALDSGRQATAAEALGDAIRSLE